LTSEAGEAAVPPFFTVADSVTGSVSTGAAGEDDIPVTVRSGFGAATPITWSSATWPLGAPVFAVKESRRSAAVPLTGTITVLPEAGLKVYVAEPTSVANVDELCSRPWTENVCCRVAQMLSGFSLTRTCWIVALAPSFTVRLAGYALPSQYVVTLSSLALVATNV